MQVSYITLEGDTSTATINEYPSPETGAVYAAQDSYSDEPLLLRWYKQSDAWRQIDVNPGEQGERKVKKVRDLTLGQLMERPQIVMRINGGYPGTLFIGTYPFLLVPLRDRDAVTRVMLDDDCEVLE